MLYQNDDFGKDYLNGLKDGLGDKASQMIVAEESYETTEPTVDSQIVKLKATGADVFINIATPKFAAQAIKKVAELGWKPVAFPRPTSRPRSARDEAGRLRECAGHDLSAAYLKDAAGSAWKNDRRHEGVRAFMAK